MVGSNALLYLSELPLQPACSPPFFLTNGHPHQGQPCNFSLNFFPTTSGAHVSYQHVNSDHTRTTIATIPSII
ncbi:hypothetical protein JHK82_047279 [Glycine max]|uniref:Uncharacterized protein n=1 Tax=Glycine max TaxID=3847 RepID=K7ML96_SOYBN|nr:hypothetical protein JHK86_047173 [Glycine max]KAG4932973.1 hypothetical protein JHK87_046975 [Glycine soja]KAG4943103.1 hypothetical protein JHK85_047749 [Glycine max]KAG5097425.1 hypothetical protein JHK82_047279 [Glycine max]KAG5102213.1 hypothetical protein JHK84_047182 [Glycine max]